LSALSDIAEAPRRPALRWHGGKWLLAPWVLAHCPPHRVYVEPFGGAASVLLRKPRSYAEVYNDLDQGVVNLFRVLRDPADAAELRRRLALTPFAREEFEGSYVVSEEPIEEARRLVVRSYMGFGSAGTVRGVKTGFRACSTRAGTTPAHDWADYAEAIAGIAERMRGVIVESRPAIQVMRSHDGPETLHYVDPPYLPETRSNKSRRGRLGYHVYAHEMAAEDHADLLTALLELSGMVVLSGYPAPLYDEALKDWKRVERQALADGARPRTEVLWLNQAAVARLDPAQPCLFAHLGNAA
jgi:DNA adenine methylase